MAIQVSTTVVTTQTVTGSLHANQISFVGDNLVNAQGLCIVSAKVFVPDPNGGYLTDAPDKLATTSMDIQSIYGKTYLNGTVTGAQVLGALAEMCEIMWNAAEKAP